LGFVFFNCGINNFENDSILNQPKRLLILKVEKSCLNIQIQIAGSSSRQVGTRAWTEKDRKGIL
jgi:hypothetical protein